MAEIRLNVWPGTQTEHRVAGSFFEVFPDVYYPPGSLRIVKSNKAPYEDLELPGRWYLGAPSDLAGNRISSRLFSMGEPVPVEGRLCVSMQYDGLPLDFTFAGVGMPVVTREVAHCIRAIAPTDIQWIPAQVEGHGGEYAIMNIIRTVPCLDHTRSRVTYWTEADGRPEKVGRPRMVIAGSLFIDPQRTDGAQVFRISDWEPPIIVSDRIKTELEQRSVSGIKFLPVSD